MQGKPTTTCLGITMLSDVYTLLAVTLAEQYTYTACNGTLFDSSGLGFLVYDPCLGRPGPGCWRRLHGAHFGPTGSQ